MALTPEQIQQYRNWINTQYGGQFDPTGQFHGYGTSGGGGWNFDNGDFARQFTDGNSGISVQDWVAPHLLGAAQSLGLSDEDIGAVLGAKGYEVNAAQDTYSPDQLSSLGRNFIATTGAGDPNLVRDSVDTSGTLHIGGDPLGDPNGERGGRHPWDGRGGWLGGDTPVSSDPRPAGTSYAMPTRTVASYSPSPELMDQIGNVGDTISRQFAEQILPQVRSGFIQNGTYGSAKTGVAEGLAAGRAGEAFDRAATDLLAGDYQQQSNRNLQQYGTELGYDINRGNLDLGFTRAGNDFSLGERGLDLGFLNSDRNYDIQQQQTDNQRYGMDLNYDLGSTGQQLGFYTQQRGQDLQALGLGAELENMGVNGEWGPLTNYSNILRNFTGLGGSTTSSSNSGGGGLGFLGGALGAGQFANNMGWWR